MTAILYIQITQPFPDGLRGDTRKPTREDHSDRGYLALDRRHIGDRHLAAVADKARALEVVVHGVVAGKLKGRHAAAGERLAAENGGLAMDELAAKVIPADVDLSPLTHESELALMRKMDDFGPLVAQAARDRAAFRLTHYAQDLASLFHSFYTNCHVIGEEEAVTNARLALVDATRIVLAKTLDLLGVTAPAKM